MGLLTIEKRNSNKNSNKNSNNKKKSGGKYFDFDASQMPMPMPVMSGNVSNGQKQSDVTNPRVNDALSKVADSQVIGTFDKKKVDKKEDKPKIIAPTGVIKQKNHKISDEIIEIPELKEKVELPENIDNSYNVNTKDLNPLDNANNPIPVNPIAPVQEELVDQDIDIKDVKANLFSLFGMMVGMTFKPGTTIVNNAKKYKSSFKALSITAWITLVSLVLCLIVRVLVGSFVRSNNAVTGASKLQFNPALIFQPDNYVEYLAIALLVSLGLILIMSLVYYSSSFLNSKGIPLGSYITISNISMLPFIVGVVVLYPIGTIFSTYLGVAVVIFTLLYSLITFFIGMNRILQFRNIDRQILYNVLNLSLIVMVMILLVVILIRADILSMPDLIL